MENIFHVKISFKPPVGFKNIKVTLKCKPIRIGEVGKKARVVAKFIEIQDDRKKILDQYLEQQQLRIINEFKLIQNLELGRL
jgi:hypothetical protein